MKSIVDFRFKSVGEVFASRRLSLNIPGDSARNIDILLGRPRPFPDSDDYYCTYQVLGIGDEKVRYSAGADGIQALQAAMSLIAADLRITHRDLLPHLKWMGNDSIGFPLIRDWLKDDQ